MGVVVCFDMLLSSPAELVGIFEDGEYSVRMAAVYVCVVGKA
jgi:hypothetical protein